MKEVGGLMASPLKPLPRRLFELLEEQQEPFLLHKNGCSKRGFKSKDTFRCWSLNNHEFRRRRARARAGILRCFVAKLVYLKVIKKALNWERCKLAGCFSEMGSEANAAGFRRLSSCRAAREGELSGEIGWKEIEHSPVSVLELHSDEGSSDHSHLMEEENPSTTSRLNSSTKAKAKAKATPPSTDKSLDTSAMPAAVSEPKAPSSKVGPGHGTNSLDVEGYSIHIRNLPSNSTTELVEEELKKFGPIKPGGVQVRNHKIDNFCYGFVEFELLTSMEAAIKASPISIGGRPSFIEEKRTTTRVVNGVVISSGYGRGWFPPRRGGMRNDGFRGNDNFRGRGGFGGNNQGYGWTEVRNRGEYLSRGGRNHGSPANGREGYQQRGVQNGNGRMARPVAVTA